MNEIKTIKKERDLIQRRAVLGLCSFHFLTAAAFLLALMAVLAQALLTLVRGHLVALLLFSVWHNV